MPVEIERTELEDVLVVKTRVFADSRGFFLEVYSQTAWEEKGLRAAFVQDNLSKSSKGTLRGMHYQLAPHAMGKLVRVVSGAAFDVAVDLRRGSPTFGRWVGHVLTGENGLGLWIPAGFAHGFLALEDETYLLYKCTAHYAPQSERSLNYADPKVGIRWPMEPALLSPKDAEAPMLDKADYNFVWIKNA